MKKFFSAIFSFGKLALPFLMVATSTLAQSNNDPLKPYTKCEFKGDLKVREVTRRKNEKNYREIESSKGKEKISVVDGYRVMFAYNDVLYYFANVKIEQSDPAKYLDDKAKVIDQLKDLAATTKSTKMIFSDKETLNGFEHYGIDRDKLDVGGQVGVHLLLNDVHRLIITLYFLNQDKPKVFELGKRRFDTIEEYHTIKNDFLNRYSACLKTVADSQP